MSKEIPFEKSFASHEKAKYWSDKNLLKSNEVFKSTRNKYIFNCNICMHEFISSLNSISNGTWCPYCRNLKLCDNNECNLCLTKSFASNNKAIYWNETKNIYKPRDVFKSSGKSYYFICHICNHELYMKLNDINAGNWCGYCSSRKLCNNIDCVECFNKSFASHEKAINWSDENKIKPRNVFKNSNSKFVFNCNICEHILIMPLNDINSGNWCIYCANLKLCDNQECKNCLEKSFASHETAKYWSDKNVLKPNEIVKGTNKKFWFKCNICNHEFEQYISVIIRGGFCSYCNGDKLCDNQECKSCFEKSFASHEKAIYWSNKNKEIPRKICKKSSKNKYIFECNICNHLFDNVLSEITRGYWCPYCCNPPKKLCDDEGCKKCFDKSFASSDKSKFWCIDNNISPRNVFKSSNKKFMFKCEKHHEFDILLNNIMAGKWCRYCVNKTEQKLFDNLQPIYTNLMQQYKVDWCKSDTTKKCYPFDFILEEQKIIIELDGRQHFEQVSNWDNPEKVQERDKYKMKQANDNEYSVIRILQEDVYYDTYQWLEELKENIAKLISENKVQNIFMCKDNEYSIFTIL